MKLLSMGLSVLFVLLLSSCEPYVPEPIENLAAEFASSYSITEMETHLGETEEANGDDVTIEIVNDSTINVSVEFSDFNRGVDLNISGLELYQSGEFAKFNQDFDEANVSGGTATDLVDSKIFLLNIEYENEDMVMLKARAF